MGSRSLSLCEGEAGEGVWSQTVKGLVCLAKEFQLDLVGNSRPSKNFKQKSDRIRTVFLKD